MTLHPTDRVVQLEPGELFDIEDGEGLAVTCVSGAVWVTQSYDPRDVVLTDGESFVLDRPGLALVSAPGGAAAVRLRGTSRLGRTSRPPRQANALRSAA